MDDFVCQKLDEWNLSNLKDVFQGKFYEKCCFMFWRETKKLSMSICFLSCFDIHLDVPSLVTIRSVVFGVLLQFLRFCVITVFRFSINLPIAFTFYGLSCRITRLFQFLLLGCFTYPFPLCFCVLATALGCFVCVFISVLLLFYLSRLSSHSI